MRRRKFITLVAGTAAAWPFVGHAQKAGGQPIIGFLGVGTEASWNPWVAAFLQRLSELGWIDGRTVRIEYRWAQGHAERLSELAAELVRLVTQGTSSVIAAKQATLVIPIVFASAGDPVGTGLVTSLARPGGNITGLSSQMTDTATKRLGLLREVLPAVHKLGIITNDKNPLAAQEASEVQSAANALGFDVAVTQIQGAQEIYAAFGALTGRAEAIYVVTDPLINENRLRINAVALTKKIATIYGSRDSIEAGGLMSYGVNFPDQFRRAAEYVDKILPGARPGDLPVEQPVKFELVINLKTAKTLGLTVPASLLARAEEVTE